LRFSHALKGLWEKYVNMDIAFFNFAYKDIIVFVHNEEQKKRIIKKF